MKLQRDDAGFGRLLLLAVGDVDRHHTIDLMDESSALRPDAVLVPLGKVDRCGFSQGLCHPVISVRFNDDPRRPLGHDAATTLLVEHPGIGWVGMDVHLVSAHHECAPLGQLAGAILDPRIVVADHAEFQSQFEILHVSALPDEKGVR